ncbi:uncharacterized protein E0L32_009406 [Thyridium curvatum]|uniref:Uncharacterized protein n=1 Tax=Thyridium curvatum TaxID=1093900 RepID=A0A507AJ29_9PEZI|nr:uncharacterized protein E0L32_009406 [Thyridium curvatum]TPX09362.1 hypothetical protein E0L32_009406 [Thyridium curvatum]
MVYSVDLFATNLSPWDWVPTWQQTVVSHGYNTYAPQVIVSGQADGKAGVFEAARGTWTGTTGASVYDWPGDGTNIVLLIDMPYVGDNSCRTAFLPKDFFYPSDDQGWNWDPNGNTEDMVNKFANRNYGNTQAKGLDGKYYELSCVISQGTQVDAHFTMQPVANSTTK